MIDIKKQIGQSEEEGREKVNQNTNEKKKNPEKNDASISHQRKGEVVRYDPV